MVEIGNRIESADKYGYYHAILADGDIYISKTEYNYRMNQLEGWLDKSNTKRAELEAQLEAAQERERWIPASEAPPKNGPYLILFKGKVIYATFLTNGWYQGYYANSVVPDAWRELPAPPEEAADDHK